MTGWRSWTFREDEGGMTNLAVVEAPNSEMECWRFGGDARGAASDKSAALVTPDRAGAAGNGGADPLNLEFDDPGGDALLNTGRHSPASPLKP
jgi:ATP-dependent helicase/nuclease subunit B